MELIHVKGNTYYVEGRQIMPMYLVDDKHCILMDPGRRNERDGIDAVLAQHGLTPVGIMITHMHYDHHENTTYYQNKFPDCQIAMPRQDAELCRDRVALRNHVYTFHPALLDSEPRLRELICHTDYPILPTETKIHFAGADFGILHTPGHSPSHICIITPDDVCFAGDCLMTEDDLETAKIPFIFDLAEDMNSKRIFAESKHDLYLFAHQGIRRQEDLADLTEKNFAVLDSVLEVFLQHIPAPRSLCEIYAAVNQHYGLANGHPMRAFYLERYLRPYLDYLMDIGKLVPADGGGAPTLAKAE